MSLFDPPPDNVPPGPEEARALVALALAPGVGPQRVRALRARFGSAQAAWRAPAHRLAAVDGVGPQTAAALRAVTDADVEREFARAEAVGAAIVTLADVHYPALLARIYDPPAVLWVLGEMTERDARAVAVVGTRRATAYGKRVAESFAGDLARRGYTVVSGLAYGVDVAAHRAALEAGGRTLAVLGSGVDRVYPERHLALARQIVNEGMGAVLSEFPLGTPPAPGNFPRRNRVVAGLSLGTLVAEARESGGALITAMMALEQDREVFAAPAPLFSGMEGTNRLIQRGYATLVSGADDVERELAGVLGEAPPGAASGAPQPDLAGLGAVERKLWDALSPQPMGLESVCEAAGVEPSTALVYLLSLEFKGLVRQMAGKQFFRA